MSAAVLEPQWRYTEASELSISASSAKRTGDRHAAHLDALRSRRLAVAPQALGLSQYQQPVKDAAGFVEALKVDTDAARFTRLQKGVGMAGKLHQLETEGRGYQVLFVTLTYRPGVDWDAKHLTTYMDKVRNHHRKHTGRGLRYVWVGEIQDGKRKPDAQEGVRAGRGVIHYHAVFWVKRGYFMPMADKAGFWPHGMTKTEKARLDAGSVVYLMAYIKKHASKEGLPHGARVFGVGGLSPAARNCRRWVHMPRFLQARYDCRARVGRAPGGGWVDADGCRWAPEWGVAAFGKGYTRLLRLRTYPPTGINPDGPFSWLPSTH